MATKQISISMPCPVCSGPMKVRELECPECNVTVRGDFGVVATAGSAAVGTRYDMLNPEQATFLETFLRCRGIIRDVEAALGISYPTVRARLDALLNTLGLTEGTASASGGRGPAAGQPETTLPQPEPASVKDILAQLDSGSIDAQSALDALRSSRPAGETSNN